MMARLHSNRFVPSLSSLLLAAPALFAACSGSDPGEAASLATRASLLNAAGADNAARADNAVPRPNPPPLSSVAAPVPSPSNIVDGAAAIRLGKALFWDVQVATDRPAAPAVTFMPVPTIGAPTR